MEFLQGRTLKHCLTAKPLLIDHVVQLGLQLADALEAAHASGIVHRDIKPANIFITDINHLKVLDFGLAKLMRPANEFSTTETLTEAKTIAGTLPYMAPEQLRGQKVDGRTDLYAFGTVLYEMATGRRPFREELPTQLIDDIRSTSHHRLVINRIACISARATFLVEGRAGRSCSRSIGVVSKWQLATTLDRPL
jgi:serine/threonine protein kinase